MEELEQLRAKLQSFMDNEKIYAQKIIEKQEQLDTIFKGIAELYDKIEDGEIETQEILEELARIQNYAK